MGPGQFDAGVNGLSDTVQSFLDERMVDEFMPRADSSGFSDAS